ncbi:hypothetical protein ACFQ1E_03450 [Sphingomonas canadensis]|uniref:Uncharacterized protein n=1 Tax=Sphingomonas canadensis TaxID=1219257 RepID=A0ABW3H2M4_9SPHN|nr:hypothetical protein [Sphingomonas canadensis]MCW3834703.1 hypothetical protein [Sphingomonas canadensis]
MRKTLILSIALATAAAAGAAGAAALAQTDPRARIERTQSLARPKGQVPQAPQQSGFIPDQGVHNALHAAHQSQIVFTRSDLTLGAITEAALASDFTLGQPIFFRVYTERSAVNAIAAKNRVPARQVYADGVYYTARFTIAGQTFDTRIKPWGGRNDHQTWTTWRGQLGNPDRVVVPGADAFLELLSRATAAGLLQPGRHTVGMELIPATNTEKSGAIDGGVVARGSFSLTVPAGAFAPANKAVCGPGRGAAGSAAIEARALAVARQYWDDPELTPIRVIAAGDEWKVERNEITGIPLERSTRVDIVSRGAKYCARQIYTYTEKYMGGGNFSTSTGGISVNFEPGFTPCGCAG